jgi:hypothetical protein
MLHRFAFVFTVVAAGAVLAAGSADAFQCPKLVAQINNEAGNRLDGASYEAKELGATAAKLHAEGKHAEAEKAAKDGLAKLGSAPK